MSPNSFPYHAQFASHSLHLTQPSPLFICSSIDLFPNWIHTLRVYLESSGLSDILPDTNGHSPRRATPTEEQGLISLFFNYVPQTSYPDWVVSYFRKNMHPYDIVNYALTLDIQRCNVTTILRTLTTFSYKGEYPAFQFTSQIHHLISKLPATDLHYHDTTLKEHILNTLHGSYETIAESYFMKDTPYTIDDIFHSIQKKYNYQHKNDRITY